MESTEFDLETYLANGKALVERELERRMPAADARPTLLHEAMRYSLFTGGKRLRPILCLAAAELVQASPPGDAPSEAAILAALSVEVFHTYTLVHDDLPAMDDDSERRGKPTVHVVYGDANAILVGDALQALAFQWAAEAERCDRPPAASLVAELARAGGSLGVVGGQVEDLASARLCPTPQTLDFIHQHKTADLFRAALRMGAMSAGAESDIVERLGQYGNALGLAFQIVDDLLDADERGVPRDEANYLVHSTVDEARNSARGLTDSGIAALDTFDADAARPLVTLARHMLERVF